MSIVNCIIPKTAQLPPWHTHAMYTVFHDDQDLGWLVYFRKIKIDRKFVSTWAFFTREGCVATPVNAQRFTEQQPTLIVAQDAETDIGFNFYNNEQQVPAVRLVPS